MSKCIDLAKKLKALANRGIDGEKINAETMLNALMKKHGITIEEIEGEKIEDYYFQVKKEDIRLWHQIIAKVDDSISSYGEFPKNVIKEFSLKGNHMLKCTTSQYVEIEAKLSFYKKLYEEELEIFFIAFLSANDLLVKESDPKKAYTKRN